MEKFEIGDKVKVVRLDTTKTDYVPELNAYLGRTGIIRDTQKLGSELRVEFDNGNTWWFYPEWLELVEKKKKGWAGKIVVAGRLYDHFPSCEEPHVETGKVYSVNNGQIILDHGRRIIPKNNETFDDIRRWMSGHQVSVIEFKGFCKNGKE